MSGASRSVVHGTALALAAIPGQAMIGILLRGPAGIGKTTLALSLIEGCREGRSALIADDAVSLRQEAGTLIAEPIAAGASLVEIVGTGLARLMPADPSPLYCAFTVTGDETPRLPEPRIFAPFGPNGASCPEFSWRRSRGPAGLVTFLRSILAGHDVLCGHDSVRSSGHRS